MSDADVLGARAAWLVEMLVSPRCGLVTDLSPQVRGPDEPCPPHLWTATLAHYDFRNVPRTERLNAGKGRTEAEARLSALGESVERYSAYHWDDARVRVGPAAPGAITPADCVLHSAAQYEAGLPYPRWSPEIATAWIDGIELPMKTPVDLPAALVYLVSPTPRPQDHVTAITSNGLSAGSGRDHAVLGGLYEVIERDALMITWLNRLPATQIAPPESGCHAAAIIRFYARFGVTTRLLKLPTDQAATVVMAIADNPEAQGGARIIGMGCDLDPIAAVDKAVFEMCQARPSMAARLQAGDPAARLKTYADVRDLDDHPLFHTIPAHRGEFDFLFADGRTVDLSELTRPAATTQSERLALVVETARRTGGRVAFAEVTAPDIAPLGLNVVRCFITGFQPIHFGYGEGRLAGRRLFEAPVAWGLRDRPLTEADLNPCPHPLA